MLIVLSRDPAFDNYEGSKQVRRAPLAFPLALKSLGNMNFIALSALLSLASADVYMHNPRGEFSEVRARLDC